jgi:hypothetical protein
MAKITPASSGTPTKHYKMFLDNLWKLAYFVGTTETWYGKQVKILLKQVRTARRELPLVERKIAKLEKSKLSKADERKFEELDERAYDLVDIDVLDPLEEKLFRQYPELLRVLGLSHLITIFEGYLVDIVRGVFLTHPDALKSGKQLNAETVLQLGGQKQIVSYLAEKEVEELLYKGFPEVVDYFDKKFSINLNASTVPAEQVVEILATRNIHVHNRGMVSRRYLQCVKKSTLRIGTYKPITREYLRDSINLISKIAKFIDTEVQRKYFANPSPRETY